ncbi:MAG TPA: hypothetical protein VFR17_09675 [Mycobacterium sp.]|nr:hypothetical protein [Mycobacterium sp.]
MIEPVHAGAWRTVLRRGVDAGYRLSDLFAQWVVAAMDPRARLMRQRRRALRWGLIFGAACGFWMLVTAVLASVTTPAWALLIPGLLAAGAAGLSTLLLLRYRWLRATPLPARRPGAGRQLPPPGSAARPAMSALGTAEGGLFSLLGVLDRGRLLPAAEIGDLTAAAERAAAAMAATAAEVVSMERTVQLSPDSREYLTPTIGAFSAQLGAGVRQYNEMVTAAAQLVAAANGGPASGSNSHSPMARGRYRDELVFATDRLLGWAQAFDELGGLRRV